MKHFVRGFIFLSVLSAVAFSQTPTPAPVQALTEKDYVRVDADPVHGFGYPYYLYVPAEFREAANKDQTQTILVAPNNTGKPEDDLAVHEFDVKRRMMMSGGVAAALKVAVLMPVFPRPKSDWRIYTQALDRDSMVTDKREYRRLDQQMVAMIDHAIAKLKNEGLKFDQRVLLNGFSAQGMFVNRFTFLHPDRVKAAAIGSPGGWPMAPVEKYKGKSLRYPIGTADFKTVSGKELDLETLRKVPLFVFIGDKDTNDSVPFDDSYDDQDRDLINPLFGKTPVERWAISESLYKQAGLRSVFKLYPDVAHTVTPAMRDEIRIFLLKHK
jgi:dienelactone hydrolase